MKQRTFVPKKQGAGFVIHALISAIVLGVLLCAMMAAFSVFLCNTDFPTKLVSPLATTAAGICLLAASFLFGFLEKQRGLVLGLAFALVCNVVLFGVSFLMNGMVYDTSALYKAAAVLCFGAMGGYLGMLMAEHASKLRS